MVDHIPSGRREGTMVRVARWLLDEVGEGAVFTKDSLRMAFPAVGQVDRRMRDLRDYDWVIHTNLEDGALAPSELRFVHLGAPVWERGVSRRQTISSVDRRAALLAASFMCSQCGVSAGNAYPDNDLETGVLAVHRSDLGVYVSCGRCGPLCATGEPSPPDLAASRFISGLTSAEIAQLQEWLASSRPTSAVDKAWSLLSRLSASSQEQIFSSAARRSEGLGGG